MPQPLHRAYLNSSTEWNCWEPNCLRARAIWPCLMHTVMTASDYVTGADIRVDGGLMWGA